MALKTGHKLMYVEEWPDRIKAVTLDDVNAALRDLATNPHYILGVLLPDPHASRAARETFHPSIIHDGGIK